MQAGAGERARGGGGAIEGGSNAEGCLVSVLPSSGRRSIASLLELDSPAVRTIPGPSLTHHSRFDRSRG